MKNSDYLDLILSDTEKAALSQFIGNDLMREAVKKVLLAGIHSNGTFKKGEAPDPLRNFLLGFAFNRVEADDAALGRDLRAQVAGINTLEVAFNYLERYQPVPEKVEKKQNQAR